MVQSHFSPSTRKKEKRKPNRGPRLTSTGLRLQHPERGGTEGGNALQHETQAVAQEQTESDVRAEKRTHKSPQAQRHPPQTLQPREQRRQLRSRQHHAGSGNSPAGRRESPGARACNAHEPSPHQRSPHAAPDAPARERVTHAVVGPTGPPRGQWGRGKNATVFSG
jgi:hypothetical protein